MAHVWVSHAAEDLEITEEATGQVWQSRTAYEHGNGVTDWTEKGVWFSHMKHR